jgi:hypothetical protein
MPPVFWYSDGENQNSRNGIAPPAPADRLPRRLATTREPRRGFASGRRDKSRCCDSTPLSRLEIEAGLKSHDHFLFIKDDWIATRILRWGRMDFLI